MKNRESSFSIKLRHYILANPPKFSGAYEVKQTTTDSIPFSCVEEHQQDFADAVRWGKKGVLIRVESGTVGASDYIFLRNSPSYFVIKFKSGFVIIDADTFKFEKQRSKRKSLTWERAQQLAYQTINLSNRG